MQVGWCRGGDQDREAEAPETAIPVVNIVLAAAIGPEAEPVAPLDPLRWRGAGNIVSAAGCALLSLVGA